MRTVSLCLSLLVAALGTDAVAQDWPHWRGPNHDGSTAVTGLPDEVGPEDNLVWRLALAGPGASTPIVLGKRIFLSLVDRERERLVAMCADIETGEVVWTQDAGSGYQPGGRGSRVSLGRRSNYASPSPATDGQRVVFFFGNGDLVSYSLDGEEEWRRNLQEDYGDFAFQWTFSASPTICEGTLVLPILQRDVPVQRRRGGPTEERDAPIESFLLGLEPGSGEERYRHVRPSDANMESLESYATPIPFVREDGRTELLVVGGDVITGHDPRTGAELWRWGTWNEDHREQWWRLVPSPVVAGDVALVCAPKRAPVYAVTLNGEGDLGDDGLVWDSGRRSPVSSDVPTPAVAGGFAYVLSDVRSALSKVDPKTGEVAWTTELGKDFLWRASPTVADGRVWLLNHGGELVTIDAESGEITHRVMLGEEDDNLIRSSVVIAQGRVFVRTNTTLFCFGS